MAAKVGFKLTWNNLKINEKKSLDQVNLIISINRHKDKVGHITTNSKTIDKLLFFIIRIKAKMIFK